MSLGVCRARQFDEGAGLIVPVIPAREASMPKIMMPRAELMRYAFQVKTVLPVRF